MATLPPLAVEILPRVLGLTSSAQLPASHVKALHTHYLERGCVVFDVDQQTAPLACAMPLLLNSSELWKQIRLEMIQQILQQQLSYPLVLLNLRPGMEADLLQRQHRQTNIFSVFVDTLENSMLEKYPVVDLTLIYPHVLDSLL